MADCLFCGIASGENEADFVYEDDAVVAFNDIDPKAPTHVLVVPRRHVTDWNELAASTPELSRALVTGIADTAEAVGLEAYRVVANTGSEAGQAVFHLHFHVLGGRPMLWPPG